jgi:phospholipid/cholesterol/gamma-HCH transport system substrate-binding protein
MTAVNRKMAVSFLVGVVVVSLFGAVIYIAATAHKGVPFEPTSEAKLAFENAGTLRAGDAVKQNSVRIGRVAEVDYADGQAVVTLALDPDITVYNDARAFVADQSSLAKRFVELDPGSEDAGALGDEVLPVTRTLRATDLEDVLQVFDRKTRDRLQVAVRTLGQGAAGYSRELHALVTNAPELLDQAQVVLNAVSSDDADLAGLLAEVDVFAAEFAGHEGDVRRTVTNLAPTLEAIATRDGVPLEKTLAELPLVLDGATTDLGSVNPVLTQAREAVADLRPGAVALGEATPSVRAVLREALRPLRRVPGVSEDALPALDDLSTAMADARPLADPLSHALADLERPLLVLAPYSRDIMIFASRAASLVSMTTPTGDHMARLGLGVPGLQIVAGSVVPNLTNYRVPYPAPGTVDGYRATGISMPVGGTR